jgi:transglutaminase-like putative cysteine protease
MFKKILPILVFCLLSLVLFSPSAFSHDIESNDLSDYIRPYDPNVIELAESIAMKPLLSYPLENARSAYYWVSKNIKYVSDEVKWGKSDYWQLPTTTIMLGTGDCEDQAILLASLLRALKLPRENVRLVI